MNMLNNIKQKTKRKLFIISIISKIIKSKILVF